MHATPTVKFHSISQHPQTRIKSKIMRRYQMSSRKDLRLRKHDTTVLEGQRRSLQDGLTTGRQLTTLNYNEGVLLNTTG